MILRPAAGTGPPLISRFLLLKDFFKVACETLSKYLVRIETVWAVSELQIEGMMEIGFLCPSRDLKEGLETVRL